MILSSNSNIKHEKISVYELTELAIMCAAMVAGKEALHLIPNVHPVTMIIILSVLIHGRRTLYPVAGFVFFEIAIHGIGLWTLMYLYIWPLIVFAALPFQKSRSWIFWATFAGFFGLIFGAMCALPYFFIVGPYTAFSWWVSGAFYDVIHCVSNVILTIIALPPLYKLISTLRGKI